MENKTSDHDLIEFAEQRLKEHIAELNTHYEGREMPSNDERKKQLTYTLICLKPNSKKKVKS